MLVETAPAPNPNQAPDFDEAFLAAYETELVGNGAQENLAAAFHKSVLVQTGLVNSKTYKQLNAETKAYRNRSAVAKFEVSLGNIATNSAAQCAAHQHELAFNANPADKITDTIQSLSFDGHDGHDGHDHTDDETKKHDKANCQKCKNSEPCSER